MIHHHIIPNQIHKFQKMLIKMFPSKFKTKIKIKRLKIKTRYPNNNLYLKRVSIQTKQFKIKKLKLLKKFKKKFRDHNFFNPNPQ